MDSVEILLKEYDTLRQEILTALGSRTSILSFGQASVAAIVTVSVASVAATGTSLISGFLLLLAAPAMVLFTLIIWLGEYQRMQRAGKFLCEIEQRVNEMTQQPLLTWESHLRTQRGHMGYPYNATVLTLTVFSLACSFAGFLTLGIARPLSILLFAAVLIVHIIVFRFANRRIAELQS